MILRQSLSVLLTAAFLLASFSRAEGRFADFLCDTTLRIDYIMSGSCGAEPSIAYVGMSKYAGWGGRRVNLDSCLRAGNAEVVVSSRAAGHTLYRQTFSTLFQEWLATGDTIAPRAMEGSVLVPMPREKAKLELIMRDNRHNEIARAKLALDPDDILIRDATLKPPMPHTYIFRGERPETEKITVAIVAEGFRNEEIPQFLDKARETVDAILDHEPFARLADHFNFVAVEVPSAESGVSVPNKGVWRDTAFKSHFSTFYSDRYLTTSSVHELYDAIVSLPAQHIIVLVNSDEYGGGGIYNFYTLSTAGNKHFRPVVVHEFGHSFAGLADEYSYPDEDGDLTYPLDIEPWEPNITTLADFASKWTTLKADGIAGLVEGAGYRTCGIWRSSADCRMRTNTCPVFCPVCQHAIEQMVEWYTKSLYPEK